MGLLQPTRKFAQHLYHRPHFKRAIIRLASIFRSPPFQSRTMEFDYGLWTGVSAFECVDGRQLGEDNIWPKLYRKHPPTEYRVNRLQGSRERCPVNMTALHLVMKNWDDALRLINAVRDTYIVTRGTDVPLSVPEVFLLSKLCTGLPALMARRRNQPMRSGSLSSAAATQFKIVAGIFMIIRKMTDNGDLVLATAVDADPDVLYRYADKHSVFISPNGNACGGSQRKILELLQLAIHGTSPQGSSEVALQGEVSRSQLSNYVGQTTQLELQIGLWKNRLRQHFDNRGENTSFEEKRQRQCAILEHLLTATSTLSAPTFAELPNAGDIENQLNEILPADLSGQQIDHGISSLEERLSQQFSKQQNAINAVLEWNSPLRLTREKIRKRFELDRLLVSYENSQDGQ